jgi:hypothetical protein
MRRVRLQGEINALAFGKPMRWAISASVSPPSGTCAFAARAPSAAGVPGSAESNKHQTVRCAPVA